MKKVNQDDFRLIISALRSISSSTYLEVSWREGEEKGQTVRVDGLNRAVSKRTYEVCKPDEQLPWREWLIKNDHYAVVIRWWYGEPQTPPVDGAVKWIGGICAPWLVAPLAKRIRQDIGVKIPVDRYVWVARTKGG